MSLVVVGTDTGVGKTVTSAILLARYASSFPMGYWKPVATGASEERDAEDIRRWVGELADVLPETYVFDPPLSPHLAARLAGRSIDPERILGDLVRHGLADDSRSLVIEGAGGLLVPLTEHGYLIAHLLRDLHLPCLLVARSGLGTINHTLLSLEALRSRRIDLAGVVLSGERNPENREAIERFGDAEVVAEVGRLKGIDATSVRAAAEGFDAAGKLARYFE